MSIMTTTELSDIDREIYPMPMFVTFQVRDLVAATRWYEALGFVVLATMGGAPGRAAALVPLRRFRYQDILIVPGEPRPGSRVTSAAGDDDRAARAAAVRRQLDLGEIHGDLRGPEDTPWFTSDLVATDP